MTTTEDGMITRRRLIAASAASIFAPNVLGRAALAQSWPTRFVRIVVPYAPGGPTDIIARVVADRLAKTWGQQVVIENRGGAGTNIGAEVAARSDPDGYTMFMGGATLAVNRNFYRTLNYDPIADFAPVTLICNFSFFMFVPNSSPARSVKEFIAFAEKNKGKVTFASPGAGTAPHLCGELFRQTAGIEMTHVPYRGAGPAMNDLIPGRVDLLFSGGATYEYARSGQVRVLGITSAKRASSAPDVPTVAEAGLPGFEVSSWFAFFVPAKVPPEIVAKMNADCVAALADPAVKGRLEQLGYDVASTSPEALAVLLKAEIDKWGTVMKRAGIGMEP
jgi:tripartite-type tricarboxylate transporter receptor subunit TctC